MRPPESSVRVVRAADVMQPAVYPAAPRPCVGQRLMTLAEAHLLLRGAEAPEAPPEQSLPVRVR